MFNNQTKAPRTKNSNAVQSRKVTLLESLRSLFKREEKLIEPLAFARLYGGHLQMSCDKGIYKVAFISPTQRAHAWGSSFPQAYKNMLRLFHQKYDA